MNKRIDDEAEEAADDSLPCGHRLDEERRIRDNGYLYRVCGQRGFRICCEGRAT